MTEQTKLFPKRRFKEFQDTDAWEQRRFDSVFDAISNNTLSRAGLNYDSGKIKSIHYGDILTKYGAVIDCDKDVIPFITGAEVSDYQSQLLQDGDVLIADAAEDETVGKTTEIAGITDIPVVSGLHTIACRPKVKMEFNYLGYYMNSPSYRQQLLPLMQGIKVLSISRTNLSKTVICYPASAKEQLQIGAVFANLDHLITLHQRKLEKTKALKSAYLSEMFPAEGECKPKRRFPGFTGAWEQRELGGISDIRTGPFGSTLHAEDYVEEGTPIITTEHFKNGHLPEQKNGIPQVSAEDLRRLESYVLKKDDIVFSRVGSVDINALITPFQSGWLFSGRVLRVRTDNNIDSQYLHYELSTTRAKNDVIARAVGQTMPSINTEILKQTKLFIPAEIREQENIGLFFATLDHLITLHQRKLEKLQSLKKAYLNEMFV